MFFNFVVPGREEALSFRIKTKHWKESLPERVINDTTFTRKWYPLGNHFFRNLCFYGKSHLIHPTKKRMPETKFLCKMRQIRGIFGVKIFVYP